MQQPLSEEWMTAPAAYDEPLVKAVNPVFRDYLPANEARRMGNIMKRALVTALKVLADTGTEHPDAIVTGTSLGCLDYTERFLDAMVENGEQTLSPTFFMQSTHNTVGSALGIYTKTHGYNVTYSHGCVSFELSLLDAWMQLQTGNAQTALVGGHDEMVESYFDLLRKTGYVGLPGMVPCSEVAMSMLLTTDSGKDHLCELAGIRVCNSPTMADLQALTDEMLAEAGMERAAVSAVMTGINGNPDNDQCYREVADALFPDMPLIRYKHLFGENHTVSALGTYAAAQLLKQNSIPTFMYDERRPQRCGSLSGLLLINQMKGREYAFTLLRRP